jgi:hypothetical protein
MTAGDVIGEAHDHDSLLAVLRQRKAALRLSDVALDELAGLTAGHTNKLLGPVPVKTLGKISLDALLGALALRLIVVHDPEQAATIGGRWQRRAEAMARPPGYSIKEARPIVLKRHASKAAKARWANKSRIERAAVVAMLNAKRAERRALRAGTMEVAR